MFIIQLTFKNESLDLKYSNMYYCKDKSEVLEKLKKHDPTFECEVSTAQSLSIKEQMAKHWAKKGNSEISILSEFIKDSDYVLLFPVFKISKILTTGQLSKFKEAAWIDDDIYYISAPDRQGVFQKVTEIID